MWGLSGLKLTIDVVGVIFEVFIILRAFDLVWERKDKRNLGLCLICVLSYLIIFFGYVMLAGSWQSYLVVNMGFFLLTVLYKSNLVHKISYSLQTYCIFAACEILVGMVLSLIRDMNIESIRTNMWVYIQATLYSKLLTFVLITVLGLRIKAKFATISKKVIFVTIITSFSSIMITSLILTFAYNVDNTFTAVLTIIATSLLIFSNLYLITVIEKQSEMEATKQRLIFTENQIYSQAKHYDELYAVQDETRKIWHDMKNGLTAISEYIKINENSKALRYLENLTGEVSKIVSVIDTGCPAIDSILKSKIKRAEDNNCSIYYLVLLPDVLYIDEIDMAILIANALDNAIEYLQHKRIEDRSIGVNVTTHNEYISIKITNEVCTDIDVNNLMTSKSNPLYHGYGLASIKNIADKYDGDVDINCKNSVFRLSILIRNMKPLSISTPK